MTQTNPSPQNTQLETGTYEIITNRLKQQTGELRTRLESLNTARKEVFGAIETELIANDRINTDNSCIARDIMAIGDTCVFGYNVHIGLRSGIQLQDVFSVYTFNSTSFHETTLELLDNEKFEVDFQNLYRYYKNAFFGQFIRQGTYIYMVFQISKNAGDYKAFKWLVKDEKTLVYIDNRSESEIQLPNQYEFIWNRATRDAQRSGKHPHISILDRIFVETVGGDLTIKVEDNTDDGLGIYREEVEFPDQTLDDAEFLYADLGNLIVLKIRPYQEDFRYFIYNEKIQKVQRIDALEDSGVLLPDSHGLIFSNGYYLQTGELKVFDTYQEGMRFERRIVSPNGEDYLYVFFNRTTGDYVLLRYNVISQKVDTPIHCSGYSLFPDGELSYFKAETEPTKHHLIQIWQTPFVSGTEIPSEHTDSYLYKVGNKDIVRAMAESYEVITLSTKEDTYSNLYSDLVKKATDILDSYYWIDKEAAFLIDEPLQAIRATASAAIEEYDKKTSIQQSTQEEIKNVKTKAETLFLRVQRESFNSIEDYVKTLSELRTLRGEIISLRDLRYTDEQLITQLETEAATKSETLSEAAVDFLLQENALAPYTQKIDETETKVAHATTANESETLLKEIDATGKELELLIEIVSNLKIDDATQTTVIIDNISTMYARLNQVKSALRRHRKELMGTEAIAEFNAQLKLLDQGIINYLDVSDTPQRCDEYLTKLMIQLEELESKFAEFDEFIGTITEKREEIYNAFESRKLQLIETKNNRTATIEKAAERIIQGIQNRAKAFKEISEINSFFASDLMIDKVRDLIRQLTELEDVNKAGSIQTQLKTLKEEAIRQLRDKKDLFVEGQNIIQFGKHKFSVNVQPLDLTIVQRDGKMFFHLTGTSFFEEITDTVFLSTKEVWQQTLVSENKEVYRAEYLAYLAQKSGNFTPSMALEEVKTELAKFSGTRYEEGYVKGIHDEDAATILVALLKLDETIGLLAYPAAVRAAARYYWEKVIDEEVKKGLEKQLEGAKVILDVFPDGNDFDFLIGEIEGEVKKCSI